MYLGRKKNSKRHDYAPLTRITEPMVRDNGVLRTASWDEALARAAAGFQSVKDAYGPDAIGFFSCSKSLKLVLQPSIITSLIRIIRSRNE
jgi:anaerobic selenocysteine-containing dehydrogenase